MKRIAILASGSGTNAENIARYFNEKSCAKVSLIVTDRENAGVIERAKNLNIPVKYISRSLLKKEQKALIILQEFKIDFIVLAGFLYLIPAQIIDEYQGRIINIHPALLPNYGGKGMYGNNVHKAVLESKDTQSGISIHYVNKKYDEGKIILQARCPVYKNDTVENLTKRIHKLEYRYYPQCIEHLIENEIS